MDDILSYVTDHVIRAIIYVRVSVDRDGDEYGVTRQLEDARKMAAARGWSVAAELIENDTSAKGTVARPKFEQVLTMIADGNATAVISWDMTRFLRSARDRLRMLELGKANGTVLAFVRGSDIDLSTPAGRLTADILGSVALHEIEQKSDRQKRASRQAAEQGRRIGGRRPFGYEPDGMTIRSTEAKALKDAYAAVLDRKPLARIAAQLNAAGLYTPQKRRDDGGPSSWTGQTLRPTLLNPRYAGIRAISRGPATVRTWDEIGPALWPAIVSEDIYRGAVAVLSDRARVSGRGGQRLLTGVALCHCGATVHGGAARTSAGGHHTYRCSVTMGHIARSSVPIDAYVSAVMIERLSRPDVADLLVDDTRPDIGELTTQDKALGARLERLATMHADGEIDDSQLRTGTARLREKRRVIWEQMTDTGRAAVLRPFTEGRPAADVWAELGVDRQRAVIDLLAVVRILPVGRGTRTLDPDSVPIEWR